MKEKELRLALVCYGGVSLAVYMHGVTKEILKLARASKAYHASSDPDARNRASYTAVAGAATNDRHDTEDVYFDLFKAIGRDLDLRVIVDVIAAASAGGINAVILARALAHDLPIDGLLDVWLKEADVDELLSPDRRARVWSKWIVRPALWALAQGRLSRLVGDREVRTKVSTFLRSRWFKPPFDGANLSRVLFDAIDGMGDPVPEDASLLPEGQKLELFVTITDFFGYLQRIPIHDPPFVSEREHRHTLHFQARRRTDGGNSDFNRAGVPALIFAARATSSFPGAFPPAQLAEIDRMLAAGGKAWQARTGFIEHNFRGYLRAGLDPAKTSFIDGAVLNNKPFAEAIEAIKGRPAYRQVDRRLIYIDPDPDPPPPPPDGRPPGFFRTLKGALSDIPRNEPIHHDLAWIGEHNQRVQRLKTVIEAARPEIGGMVDRVAEGALDSPFSLDRVAEWRNAAHALAVREAGFVYDGYLRLKLSSVLEFLSGTVCELLGVPGDSEDGRRVKEILEQWAQARDFYPETQAAGGDRDAGGTAAPKWVAFLLAFDVGFRQRRLRFVLRALNQLYTRLPEPAFRGMTADMLDVSKAKIYELLDLLRHYDNAGFASADTAARTRALFAAALNQGADDPGRDRPTATEIDLAGIDDIVDDLAGQIDLTSINALADGLFAALSPDAWSETARRELLVSYVGFAFWDVLTLPLTNWRDLGEFEEIRVDRISPPDADTLRVNGIDATLKGADFAHFGAFFSRRHRENDYLWGRLHAADRLVDIMHNAAAHEGADAGFDPRAFKKRAFERILESEQDRLRSSGELFASLRAEVAKL